MIDPKQQIYMSNVYKVAFKKAFDKVYKEVENSEETIQIFDFNRGDDCYIIEVINIITNKISTFIIYKDTCDIQFIDEFGSDTMIIW